MEASLEPSALPRSGRTRWPWAILAVVVVLCLVGVVYEIKAFHTPLPPSWFGPRGFAILGALAFGIPGALIASREPRNAVGWLLCIGAVCIGVQAAAGPYAVWTIGAQHGTSTLSAVAVELIQWVWIPLLGCLGASLALFPEGRPLSRRWGVALAIGLVGTGLWALGAAFLSPMTDYPAIANPIGNHAIGQLSYAFAPAVLWTLVVGLASVVVRFRRTRGDEREQVKWLALGGAALAAAFFFYLITIIVAWIFLPSHSPSGQDAQSILNVAAWVIILGIFSVPIAIAIAITKYRLYDIDIVLRKTVVFGFVVILMTVVFVTTAAALGSLVAGAATWVPVATAFVVGALVGPFRRLAQRLADRWVFGGRVTPYEVLTEFSRRAADAYQTDDVLPRLAQIAAAGVGATRARVWVRVGRTMSVGATTADGAPAVALTDEGLPPLPEDHVEPVFHRGELLGAIGVAMSASDPMTREKSRLIADLAAQAGAVIANAGLLEELRASRQRLVVAQDEERRRLERNIHDGAQQQLVALAVKLRLLRQVADREPAKASALAEQLQDDAGDALENLRDLARGIYPPLLADRGLTAALDAQARKAAVPVHIESEEIGRFAPDVEATVYFCTLEALNNAAKYAGVEQVAVRLSRANGMLIFQVHDDGRGFDASATTYGTGLQGMADRLDAIGGSLDVESTPGNGTRVTGSIPVADAEI